VERGGGYEGLAVGIQGYVGRFESQSLDFKQCHPSRVWIGWESRAPLAWPPSSERRCPSRPRAKAGQSAWRGRRTLVCSTPEPATISAATANGRAGLEVEVEQTLHQARGLLAVRFYRDGRMYWRLDGYGIKCRRSDQTRRTANCTRMRKLKLAREHRHVRRMSTHAAFIL
jgi:hypothetical protein